MEAIRFDDNREWRYVPVEVDKWRERYLREATQRVEQSEDLSLGQYMVYTTSRGSLAVEVPHLELGTPKGEIEFDVGPIKEKQKTNLEEIEW